MECLRLFDSIEPYPTRDDWLYKRIPGNKLPGYNHFVPPGQQSFRLKSHCWPTLLSHCVPTMNEREADQFSRRQFLLASALAGGSGILPASAMAQKLHPHAHAGRDANAAGSRPAQQR
jgi:hypothetical protein